MARTSLAAATQQVKLLVGMATNKSKVDTVPEDDMSLQSASTGHVHAKRKKKVQQPKGKQFPQDSMRGQNRRPSYSTPVGDKKKAVNRQSTTAQQSKERAPAVPQSMPKHERNASSATSESSRAHVRCNRETSVNGPTKGSSLSRQLDIDKRASAPLAQENKSSESTIVSTGRNKSNPQEKYPAPERITSRKVPIIRKGRVSSLKSAVQAGKKMTTGKTSSLKSALAASKPTGSSPTTYVRKLSINSDTEAVPKSSLPGRKGKDALLKVKKLHSKGTDMMASEAVELDTSARSAMACSPLQKCRDSFEAKAERTAKHPCTNSGKQELETSTDSLSSARKRKESLKAKSERAPKPPLHNEVINHNIELVLDTSTRSTSSVQKRKASLRANKPKHVRGEPQKTATSKGDFNFNEAKELDTSNRSLSSVKSLPHNVGAAKKERMSHHAQSPRVPRKTSVTLKKAPHRQSAPSSRPKPKGHSLSATHKRTPRPVSLSPKGASHSKVALEISKQVDLSSTRDLLMGDMPHVVIPFQGSLNTQPVVDPLLGTRPPRPKTPKLDGLENQRLLNEGRVFNVSKDDPTPKQRNSDSSVTISSTLTSASRKYIHKEVLTLQSERTARSRVSVALGAINEKSQNTSQMSTCAGDIATPTRHRPSLGPNMMINSHGHGQDNGLKANPSKQAQMKQAGSLTFFGTPIVPIDIVEKTNRISKMNLMHHKDAVRVLKQINHMKREQLQVKVYAAKWSEAGLPSTESALQHEDEQPELKALQLLKTAGTSTSATLSMTGFKGGGVRNQINHDRSLIVSPFYLRNHGKSVVKRRLMCVFDGHGADGYKFAEHCQQLLPSLLSRKLSEAYTRAVDDIVAGLKRENEVTITKRVLVDTFLTMDESSPHGATGGSTATVVYQQGQKVFVANTGDSRSCVVVYRRNQATHLPATHQPPEASTASLGLETISEGKDSIAKPVKIVYISREDKPDLPDERARLEEWGGEIVEAEKNKSAKVKFHGERAGKATATLSMSRSIGDSQFSALGVIAEPVVDVIDLKELLDQEKAAPVSSPANGNSGDAVDDICMFALCASDGMMIESIGDAEKVASEVAPSLFNDDGPHPLTACHSLIVKSAAVWERRNKGKFRDDISIAVTVLRTPPLK